MMTPIPYGDEWPATERRTGANPQSRTQGSWVSFLRIPGGSDEGREAAAANGFERSGNPSQENHGEDAPSVAGFDTGTVGLPEVAVSPDDIRDEPVRRTRGTRAASDQAKDALDGFLLPGEFDHPNRRAAARDLARLSHALSHDDKMRLKDALDRDGALNSLYESESRAIDAQGATASPTDAEMLASRRQMMGSRYPRMPVQPYITRGDAARASYRQESARGNPHQPPRFLDLSADGRITRAITSVEEALPAEQVAEPNRSGRTYRYMASVAPSAHDGQADYIVTRNGNPVGPGRPSVPYGDPPSPTSLDGEGRTQPAQGLVPLGPDGMRLRSADAPASSDRAPRGGAYDDRQRDDGGRGD